MKFYLIILILSIFSFTGGGTAVAQSDRSKIESAKVAFFTERMALTPEQAQKFWPLYNEFEHKRRDIWRSGRTTHRKKSSEMSDPELKASIDSMFESKQKELNLEQEYSTKFQRVLSLQQLAQMYRAEHEFPKLLLQLLEKNQVQ